MAYSVAVLREGRRLDYRLMVGQGDFRMAASSGIVFAEALLGRDGRVSAHPGAWYPEEVLSLNRVEASLRQGGNRCHEDRPRSGGLSLRPLTKRAHVPASLSPRLRPVRTRRARSLTLRGSGPQARLRPRAPLARIVEDIARAEGHY